MTNTNPPTPQSPTFQEILVNFVDHFRGKGLSFAGTESRETYVLPALVMVGVNFELQDILIQTILQTQLSSSDQVILLTTSLALLMVLWVLLAATKRRCRDLGLPRFLFLVLLLSTLFGTFLVLYLCFKKGPNQAYGIQQGPGSFLH